VGINTESPDEALTVVGNVKLTGHVFAPSDVRVKTDIEEVRYIICTLLLFFLSASDSSFTGTQFDSLITLAFCSYWSHSVFGGIASCSASDSAYCCTFLCKVVYLSGCGLSHFEPGFRCYSADTPVGFNDTLC